MIRSLSKIVLQSGSASFKYLHFTNSFKICLRKPVVTGSLSLVRPIVFRFADLPRHELLTVNNILTDRCLHYHQLCHKEKLLNG